MPIVAMILIIATGLIIEAVFDIVQGILEESIKGFILRRVRSW